MKVVLHIDSEKVRRLRLTLNNMTNLIAAAEGRLVEGVVLVNGPAAQQVTASMDMELSQMISQLAEAGVDFYVCNNALVRFEIGREVLHPDFKVTRNGILKLVELQRREGYAYIKP
ncbi:MAG: DsrE family protein [Desulfobacterales bacterium]|nr:DsrE family protein [Desulfobacterales bacterium]